MTSVEFLFQKLWDTPKDKLDWYAILNTARQMHEDEIIDAASNSCCSMCYNDIKSAKEYYDKTYNKT